MAKGGQGEKKDPPTNPDHAPKPPNVLIQPTCPRCGPTGTGLSIGPTVCPNCGSKLVNLKDVDESKDADKDDSPEPDFKFIVKLIQSMKGDFELPYGWLAALEKYERAGVNAIKRSAYMGLEHLRCELHAIIDRVVDDYGHMTIKDIADVVTQLMEGAIEEDKVEEYKGWFQDMVAEGIEEMGDATVATYEDDMHEYVDWMMDLVQQTVEALADTLLGFAGKFITNVDVNGLMTAMCKVAGNHAEGEGPDGEA